jgi:glycosyltransferase involved in cell wall biosynthesis
MRGSDLVVHTLGNSPRHTQILRLAQRVPGLVVLHDTSLTGLFIHDFISSGRREELESLIERYHGESARALLGRALSSAEGSIELSLRAPLLGQAVARALGVVTHSRSAASAVARWTLGEVSIAPLPVPRHHPPSRDLPFRARADEVLLVTIGHANPNRGIDRILRAVSLLEVSRPFRFVVAGPVTPDLKMGYEALARDLEIEDRFVLTGALSEMSMGAVLARGDVFLSLRHPVLEAASASVLEQMSTGRPVVVLDQSHYSDLPEGSVVRLPVDAGTEVLCAALKALIEDPGQAAAIGQEGRTYVDTFHTDAAYADALASAAERALSMEPVLGLADLLRDRLAWSGLGVDEEIRVRVATTLADVFGLGEGERRSASGTS